jgi:hypothetical protein
MYLDSNKLLMFLLIVINNKVELNRHKQKLTATKLFFEAIAYNA